MNLVSEQSLYHWNTEVKLTGQNNTMKSNPNQTERVTHESQFRVLSLRLPPTLELLFLSMACGRSYSFCTAAKDPLEKEELVPVICSIGNDCLWGHQVRKVSMDQKKKKKKEGRSGAGEKVLGLNSSHRGSLFLSASLRDLWSQRRPEPKQTEHYLLGTRLLWESVQEVPGWSIREKAQEELSWPIFTSRQRETDQPYLRLQLESSENPLNWARGKTHHLDCTLDKYKMSKSESQTLG